MPTTAAKQYTSIKLTTRLMQAGIEASMGSVADSYNNALAENLWMLIKTEGLPGRTFTTRAEAKHSSSTSTASTTIPAS